MKTYEQLSPEQREIATNNQITKILESILEGSLRFDDDVNGDTLQADIDAAIQEVEDCQTPWFAGECILENEETAKILREMAYSQAQNCIYAEPHESIEREPISR